MRTCLILCALQGFSCTYGLDGDLAALRAEKRVRQVRRVVGERLDEALWGPAGTTERAVELLGKTRTPYDVAEELLGSILRNPGAPSNRQPEARA